MINWKKYFGGRESITAAERQKLESIDLTALPQREALRVIHERFPNRAETRRIWIGERAEAYAATPSPENLAKLFEAAAFNGDPRQAQVEFESVTGALHSIINQKLEAGADTIRGIYRRELARCEAELTTTTTAAKLKAAELEIDYSPDSITLALQRRVLDLRNATAKERFEYWRDELVGLI